MNGASRQVLLIRVRSPYVSVKNLITDAGASRPVVMECEISDPACLRWSDAAQCGYLIRHRLVVKDRVIRKGQTHGPRPD